MFQFKYYLNKVVKLGFIGNLI